MRTVCSALKKPVNFMVGVPGASFSVAELTAAGVKRISLSTTLYRAAMTGPWRRGTEVRESGTFGYLDSDHARRRSRQVPARPALAGRSAGGGYPVAARRCSPAQEPGTAASPSAGDHGANSFAVAGS